MTAKPIPYGRQHITDEDIRAVIETLKSDYLTQGPKIKEFETKFAGYVGAKFAVAVNNATSGLHLSATALGVKPGDKVIVTPMTFAASANCIRYCGGEVVFCDIDKDTYLMDIHKLEAMLKAAPRGTYKGIVPVDLRAILWIWKHLRNWPTNTAYGFSKTPAMLPEDIFWIKRKRTILRQWQFCRPRRVLLPPCEAYCYGRGWNGYHQQQGALRQTLSVPYPRHHQRPRFAARASGWLVLRDAGVRLQLPAD